MPAWKGLLFPETARQPDFLELYSRVFNTVEGNSTFYALPSLDTARRWADCVKPDFRFCFKVPRAISHEGMLLHAPEVRGDLLAFLEVFATKEVLGPTFLQLHPSFGPSHLGTLHQFLEAWPQSLPLVVEVRHPEFFQGGEAETALEATLSEAQAGRVLFDSRALYHAAPDDPIEKMSQTRKPKVPVRWSSTTLPPFVRFVGRNQVEKADPWLKEAAQAAAGWIRNGDRPYLFMHAPEDAFAPLLCVRFHQWLRQELPAMPPVDLDVASGDQMEFFSSLE